MGERLAVALSLLILAAGVAFAVYAWDYWSSTGILAGDYRIYIDATERWLAGGPWYEPFQLVGPYVPSGHEPAPLLYPPTLLLLLVPATFLPAVLWWAVPVAITAWAIWKLQPRPLVWPVLAFLVAFPQTVWFMATGNPTLWMVAALAVGCVRGPWAVAVLLKPTLAPFALMGAWRWSWWMGLAFLTVVSAAFLPMWLDYVTVLGNAQAPWWYSLNQVPMMMVPVIAWLGRTKAAPEGAAEGGRDV